MSSKTMLLNQFNKKMMLPMQRSFSSSEKDITVDEFLDELSVKVKKWKNLADEDDLVHPNESPEELRKAVDLSIPKQGVGLKGVLKHIDEFMDHSVRTHHPAFLNVFWAGFNPAAFGGEVIAAVAQTSMYTYELAPLASLIELEVCKKMCTLVGDGFKDGSGVLTTGGSNGNMIGLLCARQAKFPDTLREGHRGRDMCVFISDETHYSILMAANVMGMGYNNVIKVGVDENGSMDMNELIDKIELAEEAGKIPIAVVATAGSTVRGSFDPFRKISGICKEYGMWMHVDAAWGGGCLLSPKYRTIMDGADLADSVAWDMHKMTGIPLVCSAFLIKNLDLLKDVCQHGQTAHYLLHKDTEDLDLGHRSLQCGRRNDALKLWLSWKEKGDEGWAAVVERYIEDADYIEAKVKDHPRLEMMSSRVYANVCMRYNPTPGSTAHGIDLNELNGRLRKELQLTGKFMVTRSNIGDDVILRPVPSNPNTNRSIFDAMLAETVKIGDRLVSQM